MKIETKFSLRDVVVPITRGHVVVGDPCPECEGTATMALVKGGTVRCMFRGCINGKVNRSVVNPWNVCVGHASEIGQINVTVRRLDPLNHDVEIRYMIAATGIGSGTVWPAGDVFADVEEAQAECDRRNGVLAEVPA